MNTQTVDKATFILRLSLGLGMLTHGLDKYANYAQYAPHFPDILGIGSAGNLALVIFAEMVCAFLVTVGLFTRLACIPVLTTMAVAFFIVHSGDPFGKKELAFLYLNGYLALFLLGSGAFSFGRRFVADKLPRLTGWKGFLLEQ